MSIDANQFISFKIILGERIKNLRQSRGYSLNNLASLCNLEKTSISRIENGRLKYPHFTRPLLRVS